MGFLAPQNFEGTIGKATVAAIKAFERAHDLPENAVLPDDLIGEVYADEAVTLGPPRDQHAQRRERYGHHHGVIADAVGRRREGVSAEALGLCRKLQRVVMRNRPSFGSVEARRECPVKRSVAASRGGAMSP
jgi:hypothetical protein